MAKRPSLRDVARASGVSHGTVSRVLDGPSRVRALARARVTAALERIGHVADKRTRSPATGRARTMAFLLTEPHHLLFEDPSLSTLLRGAAQALSERDLSLVLVLATTPAERRRTLTYLTGGHVDGVLVVSPHEGDPLLGQLVAAGVPVVACGRPLGQRAPLPHVAADDVGGAYAMTSHLIRSGRHRVAMISGPLDTSSGVDRMAGYRQAVGDAWDERLVAHGEHSRAGGRQAMESLLATVPDLDAVFVGSDLMAAGALTALEEAGRTVPTDVSVGGFDDSSLAATLEPPLSTVHQPLQRISEEMVRLLLDAVEGKDPVSVTVPTRLVLRHST